MIDAVDYPSLRFTVRRAIANDVAAANVLPGIEDNRAQPISDPSGRIWLLLDGELLDRASLVRDLAKQGVDATHQDDAELALAAYLAFGERFYERLNGCWNLVLHDG